MTSTEADDGLVAFLVRFVSWCLRTRYHVCRTVSGLSLPPLPF
ncbi:hypothetical protein N826_34490 [Skermanella aerolata KACC 11604]|nr:hypothetical protein N826_34490 [Skermanella aerolata KACC 11604]